MSDSLKVSELFKSIQGEGFTMGRPAVFLRLSGCNLLCKAEWTCDTLKVWRNGEQTPISELIEKIEILIPDTENISLVITGGEPLLQQEKINTFLNRYIKRPYIEMETNGTIIPDRVSEIVDQFNCSPKLPSSGNSIGKFYNPEALQYLVDECNTHFKFVISKKQDIDDIHKYYGSYINQAGKFRIWLMPACETRQQFIKTAPLTAELCKEFGYNFSSRIHINIWNRKVGV